VEIFGQRMDAIRHEPKLRTRDSDMFFVGRGGMTSQTIPDEKIMALLRESAELAVERLPETVLAQCESPIERLFLIAAWSRGVWTGRLELLHTTTVDVLSHECRCNAHAVVAPQVQIGPYRVDFLFAEARSDWEPICLVAVECDGHEFHEKTKEQAARDKARDRDLAGRGVTVMRFSGSEIWRDAGAYADEVLTFLNTEWADSSFRQRQRIERDFGSVENYLAAMRRA
jgi:very-short-patch-repair endonuclease